MDPSDDQEIDQKSIVIFDDTENIVKTIFNKPIIQDFGESVNKTPTFKCMLLLLNSNFYIS
jgi:hypothetical protein